MKTILSIAAGIILGVIIISAVESLGHFIYPPPANLDLKNPEVIKLLMKNAPLGVLLFVILAWASGSLAGGLVSASIAIKSKSRNALIVGGVLTMFGLLNLLMIPHPVWFWVLGLSVFLPCAYLGYIITQKV